MRAPTVEHASMAPKETKDPPTANRKRYWTTARSRAPDRWIALISSRPHAWAGAPSGRSAPS
eukprot:15451788-Alexandrium_andersonii.AAC.1